MHGHMFSTDPFMLEMEMNLRINEKHFPNDPKKLWFRTLLKFRMSRQFVEIGNVFEIWFNPVNGICFHIF